MAIFNSYVSHYQRVQCKYIEVEDSHGFRIFQAPYPKALPLRSTAFWDPQTKTESVSP